VDLWAHRIEQGGGTIQLADLTGIQRGSTVFGKIVDLEEETPTHFEKKLQGFGEMDVLTQTVIVHMPEVGAGSPMLPGGLEHSLPQYFSPLVGGLVVIVQPFHYRDRGGKVIGRCLARQNQHVRFPAKRPDCVLNHPGDPAASEMVVDDRDPDHGFGTARLNFFRYSGIVIIGGRSSSMISLVTCS